jgi:ribulose-5-phosphate 4-epimerase/fuculose-1-phosphate aldolase
MNIAKLQTIYTSGITRLLAKGLFGKPGDGLSLRVPGDRSMLYREHDGSPAGNEAMLVPFDSTSTAGAAASLHASVYDARPDVGAVLIARPQWGAKLSAIGRMPAIFDEQVRQLGAAVEALPESNGKWSETSKSLLDTGSNAFLVGDAVLCLGYTMDRVIFNSELLEKCAKSFVLASLTGNAIGTIPWWVRYIAGSRLRKDEKKAAAAFARGEIPSGLGGY